MTNDLEIFFAAASRAVENALDELIPSVEREPRRLYEAVRWSVFAGGKRFRPALCLAVGRVFGVPDEKLLRAAAAIEMIHTYSLIHDDLPAMDDDDLRRGRATCHVKFGEATAILAGDALQSLAFRALAADDNLTSDIKIKLIAELADATARMVDGQQMDLAAEGAKISVADLDAIHANKTGAMICAAARGAAIIGGASEDELKAITEYASALGLLFQITDDLLDVTQTTEILGKTAGKDSAAAKATYPSFYGIEETEKLGKAVRARAGDCLKTIGKDASLLADLADFILHRRK